MMLLLDTNVISELRKVGDGEADPNVTAWLAGVDVRECHVSVVTLMEIELGILRLERRAERARQAARLRAWIEHQVRPQFADRTLPIDAAVALRCARLQVPRTIPDHDAYIAATALVHGLTVVTRNEADFAPTGVALINPWKPGF